ncbi:MAG: hypothetical protein AAFQ94_03965 [Bacteroidota bacterium]
MRKIELITDKTLVTQSIRWTAKQGRWAVHQFISFKIKDMKLITDEKYLVIFSLILIIMTNSTPACSQKKPKKFWKDFKADMGLSIVNKKDFYQHDIIPEADPQGTRYYLTQNIAVDINGKYPFGYEPVWNGFSKRAIYNFGAKSHLKTRPLPQTERRSFQIGTFKGKSVIRFSAFADCDCYADIDVENPLNIITSDPQIFKLSNFRKIVNENVVQDRCTSSYDTINGGWKGKLRLSANAEADIKMDLVLENYGSAMDKSISNVAMSFSLRGMTISNEMSPLKAMETMAAERMEKERRKNYLANLNRHLDSIYNVIDRDFSPKDMSDCYYLSSGGYIDVNTVDYYYTRTGAYAGSRTDWDINVKYELKNNCSSSLQFLGIRQRQDSRGQYYLELVTKIMPGDYRYVIDRSLLANTFINLLGLQQRPELEITLQDKYYPNYAQLDKTQWIKIVEFIE